MALWILLLLLVVPCFGQRWAEFANVAEWEGYIRINGSASGTANVAPMTTEDWVESRSIEMRVRLKQHPILPGFGQVQGDITGSATILDKRTVKGPLGCVTTDTMAGTGSPINVEGDAVGFELGFERDGYYTLLPRAQYVKVRHTMTTQCVPAPQEPTDEEFEYGWWPDSAPYRNPLPADGLVLRGSGVYTQKVESLLQVGKIGELNLTIEWELRPVGVIESEDEVVVSIPGHEEWRPEAGKDGARGNTITLDAVLQKKGGGSARFKAIKFEWEFVNVSREPGHALNAPVASPTRMPDMRFEPAPALKITEGDGLKAEAVGLMESSSATVSSYDWGGFAEIRVTATTLDGRRIVGYLKDDPAQKNIRLPKRADGDHIAEIWRKQRGVAGVSEWADDENEPVGDGNRGDGLTLYEEYRGFIESGAHIEGDVNRKDYFILNKAGGAYLPGLLLFANETSLAVHFEFTPEEFAGDRVLNRNHGDGPHKVDQHGVIVLASHPDRTYAIANGGPSTPRNITSIEVPRIVTSIITPQRRAVLISAFAHELLHACNVYHHGEIDTTVNWRYKPGTDDFIETDLDSGAVREVRIVRENGSRFAPVIPETGINMWLGLKNGQHSGHDKCLMRYEASAAYIADSDAGLRYKVRESPGVELCSTTTGTGVNHFARDPQSRYKEAAQGRGDCAHQILVNDGVNPPQR